MKNQRNWINKNYNSLCTTQQGSRFSCFAQSDFTTFGKEALLQISGIACAAIEQTSSLESQAVNMLPNGDKWPKLDLKIDGRREDVPYPAKEAAKQIWAQLPYLVVYITLQVLFGHLS